MMKRKSLMQNAKPYLKSEAGAVTADFIIISAALIGMGLATVNAIVIGINALGGQVEQSLSSTSVVQLQFGPITLPPYEIQRLDAAGTASWTATFAAMTDAQLHDQAYLRHTQFTTLLAEMKWSQAIQRVDYYHLITQEHLARGLSMPSDLPSTETLFQMYNDARA
jgi:hypothetical protein